MNRISHIILLIFLTLLSCRKDDDCIEGNGISDTQELREYGFDGITVIGDYFLVFMDIGEPSKNIIIEGESNILPMMFPNISSNDLNIQTFEDVCIQPSIPVKIDIYNPQLSNIGMYGNSYVYTDSIVSEYFRIFLMGSGKIEANITTDSLDIDAYNGQIVLEGSAIKGYINIRDALIKSYSLKHDSCYIILTGSGLVYVNVEKYLNVEINGEGIVYYIGEPDTIISMINGSGKIIKE